jgi:hypothetical protein
MHFGEVGIELTPILAARSLESRFAALIGEALDALRLATQQP